MITLGERLRAGLDQAAKETGMGFRQTGPVQMPLFLFDDDPDFRIGFAWSEAMLRRGIYVHPWHNMFLCQAMTEADVDMTISAAKASFEEVKQARATLEPHPVVVAMFGTVAAE